LQQQLQQQMEHPIHPRQMPQMQKFQPANFMHHSKTPGNVQHMSQPTTPTMNGRPYSCSVLLLT
jgi:hypothetical protein